MSEIVLVLKKGDYIVNELIKYCGDHGITSAWISGIGAVSEAVLAIYDLSSKSYSNKTFTGTFEIISVSGNISLLDKKIISHLHMALSNTKMEVFGGHLEEARVAATCELYIKQLPVEINRKFDENIGLNLINRGF